MVEYHPCSGCGTPLPAGIGHSKCPMTEQAVRRIIREELESALDGIVPLNPPRAAGDHHG